ncbi:hypothetical protein ACM26S_03510 [Kluyvera sichuanensis]|uniref:hypothetical protein n=1 Tax=Kluyvera sichuanensis TaxID=2725494 RepID=UPI0039F72ACF
MTFMISNNCPKRHYVQLAIRDARTATHGTNVKQSPWFIMKADLFLMKMTSIELLGYSAALCFSSVIASGELHNEALAMINPLLFVVVIGSGLACIYPKTKNLTARFKKN